MQQLMKRMFVVIALGADGAKLLLQFLGAHDLGHGLVPLATHLVRNGGSPP